MLKSMPAFISHNPLLHLQLRACNIPSRSPIMTAAPNSYVARFLPLRLPRVCVAVTDSDPAALVDKAEELVWYNTLLEFRLDYLTRPAVALPRIKRFMEYHPHLTAIATCRRTTSGGKFKGSLAAQLD